MVNRLEVAWTLAVVALIAGVSVYSTILVYQLDRLPADPTEYVTVIGHQWYWEFCYQNGTCFNSTYDAANNSVSGGAFWATPGAVVQINITGADVIKAVLGEEITQEELGGAMAHNSKSGVAHFAAEDDRDCIEQIRRMLTFLPSNNMEDPPRVETGADGPR